MRRVGAPQRKVGTTLPSSPLRPEPSCALSKRQQLNKKSLRQTPKKPSFFPEVAPHSSSTGERLCPKNPQSCFLGCQAFPGILPVPSHLQLPATGI